MATSIITPPTNLPVTLAQVKAHLRIDHDHEDALLQEISAAAVQHVETTIGQHLIERTVRQYIDTIPRGRTICLEAWPVSSISVFRGFDSTGQAQIIASNLYRLHAAENPAELVLRNSFYPHTYPNGFEVDCVSGYGTSGPDVPSNLIRAILVLCEHWYEHRGAQPVEARTSLIPAGLDALLRSARRVKL